MESIFDEVALPINLFSGGFVNYYLKKMQSGPGRELNPGPLAPEARITPLDQ